MKHAPPLECARWRAIGLCADPTQTLQAYDEIVKVILHGKVLDRAELAADRARPK